MAENDNVAMVFPDDPHVVGWGENLQHAIKLLPGMEKECEKRELSFPIGSMFWARPSSIKQLFELGLTWEDYPEEPLPYDGSMLHAIERLFGIVAMANQGSIMLTNVPGCTR
jgi:lipopolysaccharide biosynthesis protein